MKTLLALDMDGTLLNSKKEISPRTRSALKRFHDLGGIVALSTGRGMVELSDYPEEIEEFVVILDKGSCEFFLLQFFRMVVLISFFFYF